MAGSLGRQRSDSGPPAPVAVGELRCPIEADAPGRIRVGLADFSSPGSRHPIMEAEMAHGPSCRFHSGGALGTSPADVWVASGFKAARPVGTRPTSRNQRVQHFFGIKKLAKDEHEG